MGAVAVETEAGEGELAGAAEVGDLSSKGGASCQLLGAEVALGLCARQIEVAASISPALKRIFALIARQLAPSAIRTRAEFILTCDL